MCRRQIRGHWVNHFGSVNDGIEDTTRNAAFEVAKDKSAHGERVPLIRQRDCDNVADFDSGLDCHRAPSRISRQLS
jgi:hypothetical protein